MGLHDRIKGPNGNGANGNGNGAEPHASLAAAAPRDAGPTARRSTRTRS